MDYSGTDRSFSNSHIMVYPSVQGNFPLYWQTKHDIYMTILYLVTTLISVEVAQYELFCAEICDF